jgi:hypothetical protein
VLESLYRLGVDQWGFIWVSHRNGVYRERQRERGRVRVRHRSSVGVDEADPAIQVRR